MRVITIDEGKKEKMSEYAEKMLKYGGKLMQCLEELGEDEFGERDDEEWEEEDDDYGMRGGRGGRGGMRNGNSGGGYGGGSGSGYGRRMEDYGMRRSRRTGRYIR